MKRICIAASALILVMLLLVGNLCMPASAAAELEEFIAFPSSPLDFCTKLSMINNALPDPLELEMEWDLSDWIRVRMIKDKKELLSIDFDHIVTGPDGWSMRETMVGDKLFEQCDYINIHALFKGAEEENRWLEADVLEAMLLVQMACDPNISRVEDAEEIYDMIRTVIDTDEPQERGGLELSLDCYASYGVMLCLRVFETPELAPTHH